MKQVVLKCVAEDQIGYNVDLHIKNKAVRIEVIWNTVTVCWDIVAYYKY